MGIHAIFRVLDKVLHRPVEIAIQSGRLPGYEPEE